MIDPHPSPIPIRIISHNIRYATTSPFEGELPWDQRRRGLIAQLRYHTRNSASSPFICLQEVLNSQLKDIQDGLNAPSASALAMASKPGNRPLRSNILSEEWDYIGVGREDGKKAGEYAPIFYRSSDYALLESSTVWLSETPSRPSKSWDASSTRIVTFGVFKHNLSRKIILALNTHLDDQGSKSREESAKIILKLLRDLVVRSKRYDINGAFLAGDLNSQEGQEAYQVLNADRSGLRDIRKSLVPSSADTPDISIPTAPGASGVTSPPTSSSQDSEHNSSSAAPPITASTSYHGNINTFTGFSSSSSPSSSSSEKPKRIDFIHLETGDLVHEKEENWNMSSGGDGDGPWVIEGYTVLENRFEDGIWISDHRGVVGDLGLIK